VKHNGYQAGYAYIEALIAVLLVATSLTPMMDSFTQLVSVQTRQAELNRLIDDSQTLLETVANEDYAILDTQALAAGGPAAPSSYSDSATITNRRLVFLSRYDIDNADGDNDGLTGVDPGLLWIRLQTEGTSIDLQTLVAAP